MTTLEQVAKRLYFVNSPFTAKDAIKSLGAKWDADRRQWWIGVTKREAAEKLINELNGLGTPVMVPTEGSAAIAESVGLREGTPAGIVADKLEEAGKAKEAANIRAGKPAQQDPREIRLTGKGRYKGREYYAGSITKDGTKVRLLTLPDANGKYLDFWAPCSEVEQTKTYEPREVWDGRRNSGRTELQYTTLGSIAAFIKKQQNPSTRREQCMECGAWCDAGMQCTECGGC